MSDDPVTFIKEILNRNDTSDFIKILGEDYICQILTLKD